MNKAAIGIICVTLSIAPALAADAQGAGAPAKEEPPSRGLFLAALAPLLGTLAEHLMGSIFESSPGPTAQNKPQPSIVPLVQLAVNDGYYAGIAYETHLVTASGSKRVDPVSHVFRTGDRFFVRYMPNLPGRIEVANINPQGKEFTLGTWWVAAGQQLTIPTQGTFQFSGQSGEDTLRIALTPCTNGTPQRDIVINSNAAADFSGLLPACGGAGPAARTRDIIVKVDDETGFAVSRLDASEIAARQVDTRVVTLRLRHQN